MHRKSNRPDPARQLPQLRLLCGARCCALTLVCAPSALKRSSRQRCCPDAALAVGGGAALCVVDGVGARNDDRVGAAACGCGLALKRSLRRRCCCPAGTRAEFPGAPAVAGRLAADVCTPAAAAGAPSAAVAPATVRSACPSLSTIRRRFGIVTTGTSSSSPLLAWSLPLTATAAAARRPSGDSGATDGAAAATRRRPGGAVCVDAWLGCARTPSSPSESRSITIISSPRDAAAVSAAAAAAAAAALCRLPRSRNAAIEFCTFVRGGRRRSASVVRRVKDCEPRRVAAVCTAAYSHDPSSSNLAPH